MLEIENNSFSILNNAGILDGVYRGMGISINNQVAGMFIDNADYYTGKSSSEEYLRISLNENTAKQESVETGLEMVQSNQTVLSRIMDKVGDMKDLADQAASGGLTSGELSDLQGQFVTLQLEVDELAQGQLGQISLLKEDGQETIAISTSLSISIDKRDMTSDGLGLDSVDLTSDAAGAVTLVETAIADIESMEVHLETKVDSLEASQAVLDIQRTSLLAAQSAVEGINSALAMVGTLSGMAGSNVDLFIAAQANATTEAVLALLSND